MLLVLLLLLVLVLVPVLLVLVLVLCASWSLVETWWRLGGDLVEFWCFVLLETVFFGLLLLLLLLLHFQNTAWLDKVGHSYQNATPTPTPPPPPQLGL